MKKHLKKEIIWLCGAAALTLFATRNRKAALVPLLAGGWLALQKNSQDSFRGQSVIISGGSRGLGLALARELVHEYADVTILARDIDELLRAQEILRQHGRGNAHIIVCDMTEPKNVEEAFAEVAEKFGGIDMLINCAGSIVVGPWETMEQEDYEAQMKLHVYAAINSTRLVLPYLRHADSGKRIVNICSMGGKVAVPHMLPYDTSKFALAGFSQGVGAELSREGISVTTVYPTLMRTGSPIQAVFKGNHEKEFAWFQAGDIMPLISTSAEDSARQILEAARARRWELMPSWIAKVRMSAAIFFPELMGQLMIFLGSLMPKGTSKELKIGAQSRGLFDKSILTRPLNALAHEPEEELNQKAKTDARYNMNLH